MCGIFDGNCRAKNGTFSGYILPIFTSELWLCFSWVGLDAECVGCDQSNLLAYMEEEKNDG